MPLDLFSVGRQIGGVADVVSQRMLGDERRLREAVELVRLGPNPSALAEKIASSQTGSRPAIPVEPLDTHRPPQALPLAFSVLASDGSTIEPDRHGAVLCYLINIGLVAIHYGSQRPAALLSEPLLGYKDEDLYFSIGEGQRLISGSLLNIRRQTLEGERLVALAEREIPDGVGVALQDGTLILGTIEGPGLERWLEERALPSLLAQYDKMRARRLPLAAYTSRPRSPEVVGALRVLACPLPAADCSHGCEAKDPGNGAGRLLCQSLGGLTDRALFSRLLQPGERSALFRSQWPISTKYYGEHQVHFFYLNVGPEIARVEVPSWVAGDTLLLERVHSAVIDQCDRGRGYPTVLMEAHEQAVLRAAERRQFDQILESALVRSGLTLATSEKERGKRLRAL